MRGTPARLEQLQLPPGWDGRVGAEGTGMAAGRGRLRLRQTGSLSRNPKDSLLGLLPFLVSLESHRVKTPGAGSGSGTGEC